MHFRKMLDSNCLAAEDFVDKEFNPTTRTLTIKNVTMEKPPAGGKEKACFYFAETDKKAYFANGEVKKVARLLRRAETTEWIGAKLAITSGEKKFAGKPTTGMIVERAWFEKGAANVQP